MRLTHILFAMTLCFVACNNTSTTSVGDGQRLPSNGAGYSEEEIEDIKNQNDPMRQGTSYYHNSVFDYSIAYPKSFVNFSENKSGFNCNSKDKVASIKTWGESLQSGMSIEEKFAQALSEYKRQGAEISSSNLDDDNSFEIQGQLGKNKFYRRSIASASAVANFEYAYDSSERKDIDPNAVYLFVGPELGETLTLGAPPVEPEPAKIDPNAVASVAYVGKWRTFSSMTSSDTFKSYPQFKSVNAWEAQTDGFEVYLVLPARESTKVTAKNSVTGERLYSKDGRPLIVRCNPKGNSDMEITFIEESGRLTKYVPRHDSTGRPIVEGGISDMTVSLPDVNAHPDW